jgi:hypothetical protein
MSRMSSALVAAALSAMTLAVVATPAQSANPAVCDVYASKAVKAQKKNLNKGCGFTGARWQLNYGAHYSWCLGAPLSAVQSEQAARQSQLAMCGGGTKTFNDPMYHGLRLDWCYAWGTGCGAKAAKAYCNYRGYADAPSFGEAVDIGTYTSTRIFSTKQVCSGSFCDGFSFIKCSN